VTEHYLLPPALGILQRSQHQLLQTGCLGLRMKMAEQELLQTSMALLWDFLIQ
jgi:hypothetical protein